MCFPGCECVKFILTESGYENRLSLKRLNDPELIKLEEYVGQNHWITEKLRCDHAKVYQTSTKFAFLPGHRALLLDWCQNLGQNESKIDEIEEFIKNNSASSPILRELISNELSNYGKPSQSRRFSRVLVDFSIYLYIMSGKACYEVLCANLPLLKAGTVRKYFKIVFKIIRTSRNLKKKTINC